MSIVRQTSPQATPAALADWQNAAAQIELAHKGGNQLFPAVEISGSWYVPKGFSFYHRGTIYYADSNTAISGSFAKHIKMTASEDGSTCSASFLSSLSGVKWSSDWNGYFDASNNLVLVFEFFDANAGLYAPRSLAGWLGKLIRDMTGLETVRFGARITTGGRLVVESGGANITGNTVLESDSFTIKNATAAATYLLMSLSVTPSIYLWNMDLFLNETRLLPKTTAASGSTSIPAGGEWAPSRGVYVFSVPTSIRIRTSGSTSSTDWGGGTLFCDNTGKVKLYNNNHMAAQTVYYERF